MWVTTPRHLQCPSKAPFLVDACGRRERAIERVLEPPHPRTSRQARFVTVKGTPDLGMAPLFAGLRLNVVLGRSARAVEASYLRISVMRSPRAHRRQRVSLERRGGERRQQAQSNTLALSTRTKNRRLCSGIDTSFTRIEDHARVRHPLCSYVSRSTSFKQGSAQVGWRANGWTEDGEYDDGLPRRYRGWAIPSFTGTGPNQHRGLHGRTRSVARRLLPSSLVASARVQSVIARETKRKEVEASVPARNESRWSGCPRAASSCRSRQATPGLK